MEHVSKPVSRVLLEARKQMEERARKQRQRFAIRNNKAKGGKGRQISNRPLK